MEVQVNMEAKDFAVMNGPDQVRWWNAAVAFIKDQDLPLVSYKTVTKFSDRESGTKRCTALASALRAAMQSEKAYAQQEASSEPAPAHLAEALVSSEPVEDEDLAKKAKKTAAPKAKGNGVNGGFRTNYGKPAKRVDEFRPVRAGTDRAKLIEELDSGKCKVPQMANKYKALSTMLLCMNRDCGIGYHVDEDLVITLKYPGSKTLEDAIKQPAEK
jgi:hypothetical protein